jgi:hypothetical protein
MSDPSADQLLAEAHRLDAEAVQAGDEGEQGRSLRAQAAALRMQALGERVYPVLTCVTCFRLTGWVNGDGNCDACVRRAQLHAAYSDSHAGWVSVADTRQAPTQGPTPPLRARLAAGLGRSQARARITAGRWLAFVEPGDTGPIDPELGYELEVAHRDEVELTDGSGILVRFSSVAQRFTESGWQQIELTKIAHRDIAVPAEFPASLPVEQLVEAWGDYQAAVAAFNRRVWAAEEESREAQRQAGEARDEALREQRHTSDLLHEDNS